MKKEKLRDVIFEITNPEKNLGGRPKVFLDDVSVTLPMSVPSKQKEFLQKKWNLDLEIFRIQK
jgi:hypothetical protein